MDDIRYPYEVYEKPSAIGGFHILRSSDAAQGAVRAFGMPRYISFDHDLGGDDTSMVFLKWLANDYWNGTDPIPEYYIHSANPVGKENIDSFMKSWEKSTRL